MLKKIVIFTLATIATKKVFGKEINQKYWYHFSIDRRNKIITLKKQKAMYEFGGFKNRFFYNFDANSSAYYPLKLDSELGIVARLIFSEAYTDKYECYLPVAEVIRNRLHSPCYSYAHLNNLTDVVMMKSGSKYEFLGVDSDKFKRTQNLIDTNKDYLNGFIYAIIATLESLYLDTNLSKGAIGFNQSNRISPWYPYGGYKLNLDIKCKHIFWKKDC